MAIVFTAAQVRAVNQGKQTAMLVPQSERVKAGSVRLLRRRLDTCPTCGAKRTEIVSDTTPGGERIAVQFTVLAVKDLTIDALTFQNARACGHRTTDQLRTEWRSKHPRTSDARLISFLLGDVRDLPTFLARTPAPDYTHDPSRAMFAEPEPVSRGDQHRFADGARERYLLFQAEQAADRAAVPMSARIAAIQAGTVVRPAKR